MVKSSSTNFTDQLNVYIAEAGGLANTTLSYFSESLSTSTSVTQTKQSFYSVNYNGLYPLREASESMATVYFDYYYNLIGDYKIVFIVIMVVALVVLVIS